MKKKINEARESIGVRINQKIIKCFSSSIKVLFLYEHNKIKFAWNDDYQNFQ